MVECGGWVNTSIVLARRQQAVAGVGIVYVYPLGCVQAPHLTDITDAR